MFGLFAVVFFALAYIIGGCDAHASGWFTPQQSMYAGLACLALHLSGVVHNRKQ